MDSVENDIQKLLTGEIVTIDSVDLSCMPQASGAGKHRKVEEYVPITKFSVCYIVMALVFDEQGRVVLIQEAKKSCRGLWYIPAGRVEPGENFIAAAKREVLEEAGLEFEPITLLSMKSQLKRKWFRLNFIGKVKVSTNDFTCIHFASPVALIQGGKLKTLAEKDEESLQAKWFTVDEILNGSIELRHNDFFKSLKLAQEYMSTPAVGRHPCYEIGIQAHKHLLLRPVLLKQTAQGKIEVLCYRKDGKTRLPCCKLHRKEFSLTTALSCVFRDVFQFPHTEKQIWLPVKGLLTVEHCGIPAGEHDGICLTPVFVLPNELLEKFENVSNQDYTWHKITDSGIAEHLKRRTYTEKLLIPLIQ